LKVLKVHSLTGRITAELMLKAFKTVKKNRGAAGIDKQSIQMFEQNRDENLLALMRKLKDGSYWPYPLKREYIPKEPGKFRPLGIPAVRDRVAQEVVRRLIEPYFEPYFSPFSFGFRPGRNCHQAVMLVKKLHEDGYIYVLDADIKGFFDNIPHALIMKLVAAKIADGNILRLIEKFLGSGVMEDGVLKKTTLGTPQGGVMTPPTQSITLNSSAPSLTPIETNKALANRKFLFSDIKGIIFMSYEQILCGGKKPPDQLRHVAFPKAPFKCAGDCRAAGTFWDLAKTSLSLRSRSGTGKSDAADSRTKSSFYRQSSSQSGAALARICPCDGTVHQRYCHPSFGADSPSGIKTWLRKAVFEKSKLNTAMIVLQL
jgi:hypothetical protein